MDGELIKPINLQVVSRKVHDKVISINFSDGVNISRTVTFMNEEVLEDGSFFPLFAVVALNDYSIKKINKSQNPCVEK